MLPPARTASLSQSQLTAFAVLMGLMLSTGFGHGANPEALDRFISAHTSSVSYHVRASHALRRSAMGAQSPELGKLLDRVGNASPGLPLPEGFVVLQDIQFIVDGASFRRDSTHRTMDGPIEARTDTLVWTTSQRWNGRLGATSPPEANQIEAHSFSDELEQFRAGVSPWALSRAKSSAEYGQIVRYLKRLLEGGAQVLTVADSASATEVSLPDWNVVFVIHNQTGELLEATLPSPRAGSGTTFLFAGRHDGEFFPARYPVYMWAGPEGDRSTLTQGDSVRVYGKPNRLDAVNPDVFRWETYRESAYFPAEKQVLKSDGSVDDQLTAKLTSSEPASRTNPGTDPASDLKPRQGFSPLRKSIIAGAVVCGIIGLVWMVRRRTA